MLQLLWKTVWQFIKWLNMEFPYCLAIPLLGIYPRKMKMYFCAKMRAGAFVAAMFAIAERQKHPMSTD